MHYCICTVIFACDSKKEGRVQMIFCWNRHYSSNAVNAAELEMNPEHFLNLYARTAFLISCSFLLYFLFLSSTPEYFKPWRCLKSGLFLVKMWCSGMEKRFHFADSLFSPTFLPERLWYDIPLMSSEQTEWNKNHAAITNINHLHLYFARES